MLGAGWLPEVDGERFGAGEAELLKEVDSWDGCSVGEWKDAVQSGALEGFEVHSRGVGFVGGERERTNGVVAEEESAEHWAHAVVEANCPYLK